jgi:TPR repeat protein
MQNKTHTLVELEELSEIELDDLATNKGVNDARFVLGKLMVEGSSPKVPLQETKGVNWIREAAKRGSIDALEYKTYWEIRFDKAPNLNTITKALEQIVAANKSPRACNTLAEINHA